MVEPWMLSSQNGSDHGRHHGWAMDVEETPQIRMVSVLQAKEMPYIPRVSAHFGEFVTSRAPIYSAHEVRKTS